MAVRAMESVVLNVSGITTAIIVVEGTSDNTTWNTLTVKDANAGTSAASITANGFYSVEFEGLLNIRARISAYTSGTVTVTGAPVKLAILGGGASGSKSVITAGTAVQAISSTTPCMSITLCAITTNIVKQRNIASVCNSSIFDVGNIRKS